MAVAALALAGCGDEDEPTRTFTVPSMGAVRVSADEYRFDPGRIVARPGDLRLTLENDGSLAHDLRVKRDGEEVGGTNVITEGKTASASLTVEAGTYEFFCSVGDHAQLGMRGTLEVR